MIIEEDSERFCIICNIERYKFEKSGVDFQFHIKNEHSIWSYVYFLTYMKNKTPKDCNGIETEIYEKIMNGDISWFPTGITQYIGKKYSNENF